MSTQLIDRSGDDDDEPIVDPVPDTAEARANAALRRIQGGADPAGEAFELANRYTDELVERLRRRFFPRRSDFADDRELDPVDDREHDRDGTLRD